ncbi:MAG: hypothetical protein DUD27_03730 [Lachnospiraceae bacterium]|nr:MAG: hypothetical protein DUD27_03730 [Lachnospiraceae bacterium]
MNDKIKKQVFTHIPVYSGDVSGAASALYEFGGLTVIHDPSGCNSTYNTFDELRWNKLESAIYISGLKESDAISGNDERLIEDIVSAIDGRSRRPKFIALCNSPVPDIIGTDFAAICRLLEKKTGIPAFYVRTNAMHDYTFGGANAFLTLAEKFLGGPDPSGTKSDQLDSVGRNQSGNCSLRVNLLGLTPFEYPFDAQIDGLYEIIKNAGFSVCANWGKGTADHPVTFDDVAMAATADVSLVLSSSGIKAAEFLHQKFGIPYVIGDPLASDEFASVIFNDLKAPFSMKVVKNSYLNILDDEKSDSTVFIGEPVTMGSEAAAYALSHGHASLVCTTELTDSLVSENTSCPRGEAEIAESIMKASVIHGDPILKNATSHGKRGFERRHQTWVDEPHLAMSGRMFFRK